MQKLKKLIIIFIILLIVIIAITSITYVMNKKAKTAEEQQNVVTYKETYNIETVKDATDFYTVKNICDSYVQNILYKSSTDLYNMLDPNYIEEFQVTQNNVISKLNNYNVEQNDYLTLNAIVKDMYTIRNENSIYVYFINGYVEDNIKHEKKDFMCMVEVDKNNNTFYILPQDYMEKHNYIQIREGQSFEFNITSIEANGYYNKYDDIIITDEEIIADYFKRYKNSIMYDKEEAYEMLDEEYRNKRFGSFEKFKTYVNENIREIYLSSIDKYSVSTQGEYVKYVCIDNDGKYYIFNQYSIAEFKLILDTYTLELPEFLEKYNSTNAQGKVILNIQKFMDAINSYDYSYAYNCLSNGFKTNYFKTEQQFEEYIKTNFYKKNNVSYESFEEQSGLYKYKVKITNKENEAESITKTFIVKLNDGTNFEMSFNID